MKYIFYGFLLSLISNYAVAEPGSNLDLFLRKNIEFFKIRPLQRLSNTTNIFQLELGKRLFMETNLSGNRNMSCLTCHNPKNGTSDLLPLSRTQDNKGILRRNSQSLFNLSKHSFMFWDGRVHYDLENKIFKTPELNLPAEISEVMSSALAAQALFPMVSVEEMKGQFGENEIANAKNNLEAWDRIVIRLKKDEVGNPRYKNYSQLFRQAYPNTDYEKINIGHVAEAIAVFEREEFQSTGSPFNQYLNGDNSALSEKQKRGFAVFVDNGKCIACHQGGELGNNTFFTSVGAPQWGATPVKEDLGRGEVARDNSRNYFFRTPSLLNIGLTAPYMHNGAFLTLKDVIDHYNDIHSSIENFNVSDERIKKIPVTVNVNKNPVHLNNNWNSIQAGFLKNGLGLSTQDKDDLESFLKDALTDPKWKTY